MISEYKKDYEDSLIKAYIQTFAGEPWNEKWEFDWVLKRIQWVESVPNFKGFVAFEDGVLVGGLLGYSKPYKAKNDFEILELFVLPDFQSNGIGRQLIEALENTLKSEAIGAVHLLTGKDTSSESFYRKLGYERSERLSFMIRRF